MFGRRNTIFVPWVKVDGARIETTCCGRAVELITTDGKAFSVAEPSCLAGGKQLWAVCQQMHELKYGVTEEKLPNAHLFNVRRQHGSTSEVNDFTLKMVFEKGWCTRLIREFDLADIVTCRVADMDAQKVLVLTIRCVGTDMLEVVTLPLDASESLVADSIADDVVRRSRIRDAEVRSSAATPTSRNVRALQATQALRQANATSPSALSNPNSPSLSEALIDSIQEDPVLKAQRQSRIIEIDAAKARAEEMIANSKVGQRPR